LPIVEIWRIIVDMLNWRWKIAQWFELRWWRNYFRDKDKQTYLAWKRNYWNNILGEIGPYVNLTSSSTIIDLGCGPAGIFIALRDYEITAVDPLIDAYEKQTFFFKKSDYQHATFVKNTIEDFKAQSPDTKYDLVFCMNAINHVRNIETAFQNLRGLCSNEGAVIVSIDAHRFAFFKILFRLVPGDILHPHQYDLAEYKKLLAGDNWQIIACQKLKQEFFFEHYLMIGKSYTKMER
jgi:SAM-dependent methyltransferase